MNVKALCCEGMEINFEEINILSNMRVSYLLE